MRKHCQYYLLVIKEAFAALGSWKDITKRMLLFLLQSSVLFVVLYYLPILGNVGDEARMALAAALSLIISSAFSFALECVRAPVSLHCRQNERIGELYNAIRDLDESEAYIERLSTMHKAGMDLYNTYCDFDEWKSKMESWADDVEVLLRQKLSVTTVHAFNRSGSGFYYKTAWQWSNVEYGDVLFAKSTASGKIDNLDTIIINASELIIANKKSLRGLLDKVRPTET